MSSGYSVRPVGEADREWMPAFVHERWGAELVVAHGAVYVPHRLPGFVAEDESGAIAGLATYSIEGRSCELVTLDATPAGRGVGTALLQAVVNAATAEECTRLWLVTTNDNLDALAFYQKRGLRLVAVHPGALAVSRRLKPSIPLVAPNGIPIRDELELEMTLLP